MADRGKSAELGGVADQDVEPTVTFVERGCQLVDLDELAQVERHQCGRASGGANPIVDLLKTANGARRQHKMRALLGKPHRDGGADAPRGAGDEGDLAG